MPERKGKADFVHLHNHSEFSLLDGASRLDDMVNRAKELGMTAIALTDHGNMFGAIKFYKAAQKAGLKPIIGAEVYIAPGSRHDREISADVPEASFHLTLLCQDETGYYNLIKLVSLAYLEGFYYKPRIDKELLEKYHDGLIGLSGCLKGEVNWFLLRDNPDAAMQAAATYQEILGPGNFYLEVMRTGLPEQERIIPRVIELSRTLDIPVVATNDCHYLTPEDARAQDALVCIQTGKRLRDRERLRLSGSAFYFRSAAEMQELFADLPEAVLNTREVADRCNLLLDFEHRRFHLPAAKPPPGFPDEFSYLVSLAREGMHQRYQPVTKKVETRLEYELRVIQEMGFAGYFLIVRDIVQFARQAGIRVGPGRGSAGGSLVLYCLGVTDIDPLKYGLLFERFLNTERITLPDVDIDFADSRRQEVIDYIRKTYGSDSVAQIITFGTMQSRAVIRDVGRVLEIPIPEVDQIAKQIPPGMELARAIKEVPELSLLIRSKPIYQELYEIALKLEGLSRHASVHASAVVITPRPLLEFIPLYRVPDSETCTQYDMYTLEDLGVLKMDILGLRTLSVIDEAEKLIRLKEPDFSVQNVKFNDQRTYKLLQRGETVGVFQLESRGMRDLCRRAQPAKLEEIIDLIALFRPGPMDLIPEYIARKTGQKETSFEHELLKPFCQDTYGIIIYQEQVMQAAQALAGYTLGQADILRRAMGKKKPAEMAAQRETFIAGCTKKTGISRERAAMIFDTLEKFAGYGFNKSHAAGYAHLSYLTAYLKANYPLEFIAASLTSELGNSDNLAKFIQEARRMGLVVLGPDVNKSAVNFSLEGEAVRFGLAGVKNVGIGAAEVIVAEREKNGPYKSLLDFVLRTRGRVNRKAIESLIKAGAFDFCTPNRTRLLAELEPALEKSASERSLFWENQLKLFSEECAAAPPPSSESPAPLPAPSFASDTTDTLLTYEKEAFGFYFSSHPLVRYRAEYRALKLVPISELEGLPEGTAVAIGGVITRRIVRKDRKNQDYFTITLEDFDSSVEVRVFSALLATCRDILFPENIVIVQGRVKVRAGADAQTPPAAGATDMGAPQIFADQVLEFSRARNFIKSVTIRLKPEQVTDPILAKIKQTLEEFPGEVRVNLQISSRRLLLKNCAVRVEPELITRLQQLVGEENVLLSGYLPPAENTNSYRPRPGK